jgi:rhodanese-related sulfurtransferase
MSEFFMKYFWWLPFGEVPEVSAEQLKQEINKTRNRPHLLDVRTPAEYGNGCIKGALNMPMSMLRARTSALALAKDEPVVALCHSARRSIVAVRLLQMAGFENVRQLKGGMVAWERHGFPVKK